MLINPFWNWIQKKGQQNVSNPVHWLPILYWITHSSCKDDYFKGKNPKCFWFWPSKDLVGHFKNSVNFHTVVYDHICKNPGCPRRDPNYQPTHLSKRNGTCGSVYCQLETCKLFISKFLGHCKNHHPRPDLLDKQALQFRVRLALDDGFEVDDFVFMFFKKKRRWRRKYFWWKMVH